MSVFRGIAAMLAVIFAVAAFLDTRVRSNLSRRACWSLACVFFGLSYLN